MTAVRRSVVFGSVVYDWLYVLSCYYLCAVIVDSYEPPAGELTVGGWPSKVWNCFYRAASPTRLFGTTLHTHHTHTNTHSLLHTTTTLFSHSLYEPIYLPLQGPRCASWLQPKKKHTQQHNEKGILFFQLFEVTAMCLRKIWQYFLESDEILQRKVF